MATDQNLTSVVSEPGIWRSKTVKTTNISARGGHIMVEYQSKIYLFGGAKKDGDLNEVFEVELDPTSEQVVGKLLPISTFPSVYEFASILVHNKLWIFGGADKENTKNEVYVYDMDTHLCEKLKILNNQQTIPAPRTQYGNKSLIEIKGCKHFVVFGGGAKGDIAVEDKELYLFSMDAKSWKKVETKGSPPPERQGHIIASVGQQVFVHGGLSSTKFYDDIYMIDFASESDKKWVKIDCQTKPCARAAHNVAVILEDLYIFGGFDEMGQALADLWKFNTKTKTWTEIIYSGVISPRMDFAMCVMSGGCDILIHGGFNSDCMFFDDFVQLSLDNQ